jgi:hypothetical protein
MIYFIKLTTSSKDFGIGGSNNEEGREGCGLVINSTSDLD